MCVMGEYSQDSIRRTWTGLILREIDKIKGKIDGAVFYYKWGRGPKTTIGIAYGYGVGTVHGGDGLRVLTTR